jgi:Glycoside hydrolase family 44
MARAARWGFCALVLAGGGAAWGQAVSVSVDPSLDRRPVSPYVYGVNWGTDAQMTGLRWPVRRWGGNATTRYNWQRAISNRGSDWFFFNIPSDVADESQLPNNSDADAFIDQTRGAGGEPLMTLPLIGWTPRPERQKFWGFSVSKYGPQDATECTVTGGAPWCTADAGNGVRGGAPVTGNDPLDTSVAIGPSFVTGWKAHIAARTGSAGGGGVKLFNLDNEPNLWFETHRDVHPVKPTYDELWNRTLQYAAALKTQDPAIQLLGPVPWGWCEYFTSAADWTPSNCMSGPDRAAHGGLPLLAWYIQRVKSHLDTSGVRLVDYIDVHYYPQASGVALSNDESATTAARRLRSVKSLYDPAYADESWIPEPVRLIPRLREWIDTYAPGSGLKIAITEYNWGEAGGMTGVSAALAQAEVLAVFGREGVGLATRWAAPPENSLVEDAFRLYLNYDGAGAKVEGESVRAVSSQVDGVGSYAIRRADGRLYLLLFNKDIAARTANVQVAGYGNVGASLYRFSGAQRLGPAGSASLVGGAVSLSLPARSATLAVVAGPAPTARRYFAVPPCRVLDTRQAVGPYGGPALAGQGVREFVIHGRCGVPASAVAIAANLTVAAPTHTGDLRAYPGGTVAPTASVINFAAGRARANNALLPLAGDGRLAIRNDMPSTGNTHVILDVAGYFQ